MPTGIQTNLDMMIYKQLLLLLTILLSSISSYSFEALDRSVAIVEDDIILESELTLKLGLLKERIEETQDRPDAELKTQVLDHLILERIQLQMAKRAGVRVQESEITNSVDALIKKLGEQSINIDDYLAQKSMTMGDLREEIRNEILVTQIQQSQVNRRINITEQDIDNFLKSKRGQAWSSPRYHIAHILVANGEQHDAKLRAVNEALTKQSFADVAKQFSDGNQAPAGGDFGWQLAKELPNLFIEKLQGLDKGSLTSPFTSGAGTHILQLIDKQGTENVMVEQSKVRHILIKTSMIVDDADAEAKLHSIRQRVINGESFADMAREYSEDIGSMLNGGSLDWSTPGMFAPAFEQMMNQTPVGVVSPPFQSQFGWHILYVEDRRNQDMTEIVIRNQAAELLRKQRFNDELQLWLQEIRDRAYVNVML